MAVQAQQQCLSRAFHPHDLLVGHAFGGGGMLLDALGIGGCGAGGGIGDAVLFGPGEAPQQQPRSELTCNDAGFLLPSRKRARVAATPPGLLPEEGAGFQQQWGLAPLLPLPHGQDVFPGGDVQSSIRAVGCGVASTSGRNAAVAVGGSSGGLASQLCITQDAEVDALVRLEMERMRLGLQEARRRTARATMAAVERAAAGRLRAAEVELDRARCCNAELEERLRQLAAEGQAWLGVAKSHEAVAAGLRATLDQLLQQPAAVGCGGGCGVDDDAEDAQSCCFGTSDGAVASRGTAAASCRCCRGAEACVLLLPCRHLCLCRACEHAADACPVCAATKNASLQVLLS